MSVGTPCGKCDARTHSFNDAPAPGSARGCLPSSVPRAQDATALSVNGKGSFWGHLDNACPLSAERKLSIGALPTKHRRVSRTSRAADPAADVSGTSRTANLAADVSGASRAADSANPMPSTIRGALQRYAPHAALVQDNSVSNDAEGARAVVPVCPQPLLSN